MLLFMFFVCARSSAHGVLHALDVGTDLLRCGSAVLLQQLDDGRADNSAIGDACHLCGLLRGGDAKADGAGRLGVLPHRLYDGGKVGLDLAAGAGSLYRISHDLLFVFWAWHGRCFYLRNGRSVLSNKFSAYDKLWSYEDTACYGYERLLNCKMIFQLLYWAYQSFFRGDAAVTVQTMQIRNRPCRIYGEANAEYLLLQMTGEHEQQSMDNEVAAIAQSAHRFLFAAIPVESWNDALSPWEAPAVWGKQGFGGNAADTLRFLTEQVIPTLNQQFDLPEDIKIILGGYSLAGLFALWASTQTDLFYGVAAASPSVWFPGWMEFEQRHLIQAQRIYLSLGDREERTRNATLAVVGGNIRTLHSRLIARGADCTLEWNSGGHFKDADLRTAKAFRWVMEEHT